jgi:hypothetical protein
MGAWSKIQQSCQGPLCTGDCTYITPLNCYSDSVHGSTCHTTHQWTATQDWHLSHTPIPHSSEPLPKMSSSTLIPASLNSKLNIHPSTLHHHLCEASHDSPQTAEVGRWRSAWKANFLPSHTQSSPWGHNIRNFPGPYKHTKICMGFVLFISFISLSNQNRTHVTPHLLCSPMTSWTSEAGCDSLVLSYVTTAYTASCHDYKQCCNKRLCACILMFFPMLLFSQDGFPKEGFVNQKACIL